MTKEVRISVGEHRGFEVWVDSLHRFGAEAYGEVRYHATWDGLCAAIDTLANVKAKARKLALDVVDQDGNRATITGLNLGTGHFLGVGDSAWKKFYVPTPAVLSALVEIERLKKERTALERTLEAARLQGAGSLEISAETYAACLDRVEADYKAILGGAPQDPAR